MSVCKSKQNEMVTLFENAFKKTCKSCSFDNRAIAVPAQFVAWIDIMGSKNLMTNALRNAACFVGVLHQAVLFAHKSNVDVSIHSMTDGVYIVADDFGKIRNFVSSVMRCCALSFCQQSVGSRRFFVRASIAYGRVILSQSYCNQLEHDEVDSSYLHNVMLGVPFVYAAKQEHKAPPFGIYIDESVRTQTDDPDLNVAWVLHKWWSDDDVNQRKFATAFGKEILSQLDWLVNNRLSTFVDPDKIEQYRSACKEYFQIEQN